MVELTWNTPNQNAINDHRLTQPESTSQNLSLTGTHLKVVEQVRHILVPFWKYKLDFLFTRNLVFLVSKNISQHIAKT